MKCGPIELENRVSLTGALGFVLAFTGVVGGWYTFDARITMNDRRLGQLEKFAEEQRQTNERLADTLNELNYTLGKVQQRLDDANIGGKR